MGSVIHGVRPGDLFRYGTTGDRGVAVEIVLAVPDPREAVELTTYGIDQLKLGDNRTLDPAFERLSPSL